MTREQAVILAGELQHHRYWRVDHIGPAPLSTLPGPGEGRWVRLRHRERPGARLVIPCWPEDPEHLALCLTMAGEAWLRKSATAGETTFYLPGHWDESGFDEEMQR